MSVNADGNFVCNGVGVTRTLPVWTTDAQALCGQQAPAQQQGEEAPLAERDVRTVIPCSAKALKTRRKAGFVFSDHCGLGVMAL